MSDGIPRNANGMIDYYGTWCPHCHNRASKKSRPAVGVLWLIAFPLAGTCVAFLLIVPAILTLVIAGVLTMFLPQEWKCFQCQHRWRG